VSRHLLAPAAFKGAIIVISTRSAY
jgi:hypothetical protein